MILALYPKDSKIVIGCRSGQRSMLAAEMMLSAGYTTVVDLRPGFEGARNAFGGIIEPGWLQEGLPAEDVTPGGSYDELRRKAGKG